MTTDIEIGRYLARLREKAGLKQNELAQMVTWSPAVLSRVESGERPLSDEELDSILGAIATEDAKGLRVSAGRVWQHSQRPSLGHPDEEILWCAEQAIQSISELSERGDIKNVFVKRIEEFRSELNEAARLVLKTEHNIAFIGKIGVGKSTALCRITGLEVLKDGKAQPVLEVGAGGTTVCEVRLLQGHNYGLHVEPVGEDEFHREVLEFAHFLTGTLGTDPEQETEAGEQDAHGTSTEIARVIRNMSGLTISRVKLPDGKRERIDRAKNLAEQFSYPISLAGEILAKMQIHRRTSRSLWHPEISGKEPLLWLKETFEQINNGRHLDFSLPRRIDITMPQEVLGEEALSICLVDTKGIYATAERADLEAHFNDPNTALVLCSSFNDAPSTEVQQLLQRAVDGGFFGMETRAAVLVLPRSDEALAVKDDQGLPADTVADGYDLKDEQTELRLRSQKLPHANIAFFNAREDAPQSLIDFLAQLVAGIRDMHCAKLEEVIKGVSDLVENFAEAQVQEVYQQAARRMSVWLENNREIEPFSGRLEDSLISAIQRTHTSSLYASVRRRGDWHNLNYSLQLGYGARVLANRAVVRKLEGFKEITANLLQDPELEPAFGLVRQASSILESGTSSILDRSESLGKRIYIQYLEPDTGFWEQCIEPWGERLGYRNQVIQLHKNWFSVTSLNYQTMAQELVQREWRQILERISAILDTEASEEMAA